MKKKIKHGLLKAIDLTALGFLEPYVRLAYGEEPKTQLKKIGRFTVIPVVAMIAAILVWWFVITPKVQTKAGQLPSPPIVLDSATALHTFATRENAKARAYTTTGESRERWLAEIEAELDAIGPEVEAANQAVEDARAAEATAKDEQIAPLQARVDELEDTLKTQKKAKQDELKELAATLPVGPTPERTAYLTEFATLEAWVDEQEVVIDEIDDQIKAIRDEKDPAVLAALSNQTAVAEREQYLKKMVEQLGGDSREARVAKGQERLDAATEKFYAAEGAAAYAAARRVVSAQSRLDKAEESSYAKPATLYYQIRRSILCVFTGFMLGSLIAIPIGVLCGLSTTFMGAMTPFIALFKPVSPIVWLPIALIVASALIPDPDKHWFTQWLWELPLIGPYEINPAFLASAVTVALCSLWATMVNTALGVASVDKDHINVAKVLRLGFWSRLFKIVLPSSLPLVFAGLRISLGVGWMVLIAAELLSSSEGIGKFVWDQFNNGASDSFAKMMVVVFVVGAIGLLLDRIMVVFQRLVSFEGSIAAV
ncbi:MAG: ABC transporter permease subunit [Planctomycetota bacterium]